MLEANTRPRMLINSGEATLVPGVAGREGGARRALLGAASGLSIAAALAHLWAAPAHLMEWWGYGIFFAATALVQGLYGVVILRWPSRGLFLSGIAVNLGVISLFVSVHTQGMPVGPLAGEVHPVDALGMACTAAEVLLVVALLGLARGFSAVGGVSFRRRSWRSEPAGCFTR